MKTPKKCGFTKALRNLHAFFVTVRCTSETHWVLVITLISEIWSNNVPDYTPLALFSMGKLNKGCTK